MFTCVWDGGFCGKEVGVSWPTPKPGTYYQQVPPYRQNRHRDRPTMSLQKNYEMITNTGLQQDTVLLLLLLLMRKNDYINVRAGGPDFEVRSKKQQK